MQISDLREQLEGRLGRFAWEEWSQMGIFATPGRPSVWAQDPEALVLLTLEVARTDPRLFDEVPDWLLTNEHLMNLRRLRTLAVDPEDKALSEAAIAWLGKQRPKARFTQVESPQRRADAQLLFPQQGFPVTHPDKTFAEHGWLRPAFEGTRKSMPPTMDAPINLSFRLRMLFGLTARAELARLLFTMDDPVLTSATLARAAGYTKRNTHEALMAFEAAGVVSAFGAGHEFRYRMDRERWRTFLVMPVPIKHVNWIPIFLSLRRVLRWLRVTSRTDLSDYLLSSSARDLLENIRPDLEAAGVEMSKRRRSVTAIEELAEATNQLASLTDMD